jgi:hypothetical protein
MFLTRVSRAAIGGPIPLSVRYDSLLVQCMIAAGLYFGPQDAFIGALAFLNGRAYSNSVNKPVDVADPTAALEKFYTKKGLNGEDFKVRQGRCWEAKFTNMYK